MVCDRVQRERPGGSCLTCGPLAQEQKEPLRLQSSWGRSTHASSCSSRPCAAGLDLETESKECVSHDLLGLSPDGEAALQGLLVAALDIQQKKTDEMHAELLAAFGAMERRIMNALPGADVGSCWQDQERSCEAVSSPLLDPKGAEEEECEAKEKDDDVLHRNISGLMQLNQSGTKSLVHIDLSSLESGSSGREAKPRRSLRELAVRAVKHPRFSAVVSLFIWTSVLVTFLEEEHAGYKANVALGLAVPGGWGGAEAWFDGLSHFFNFFFAAEVVLCTMVWGLPYLREPWGAFDAVLVAMCLIDSYVLQFIGSASGQDFTVMRLLRCTRLLRTLQVARELKMVQPLYLFMRTIAASMSTLLWSLVFLGIFQLIGALFISRSLHDFIMDPANSMEDRLWCNRMYGSAAKALYTFFEITFSGGWPNYVRPLVEKQGLMYCAFFVFYIAGWVFAVVRIISALFIKETFSQASKDETSHAQQKLEERRLIVKRLKDFFSDADRNESGKVSSEEFIKFFDDPELKNWLEVHEVNLRDPSKIWELVDNGKEELNLNEFVEGMLRLRGPARAQDVQILLRDSRGVTELCRQIHERLDEVESSLSSLRRQRPASAATRSFKVA